jgi:hypothetical protein
MEDDGHEARAEARKMSAVESGAEDSVVESSTVDKAMTGERASSFFFNGEAVWTNGHPD